MRVQPVSMAGQVLDDRLVVQGGIQPLQELSSERPACPAHVMAQGVVIDPETLCKPLRRDILEGVWRTIGCSVLLEFHHERTDQTKRNCSECNSASETDT